MFGFSKELLKKTLDKKTYTIFSNILRSFEPDANSQRYLIKI